MVSNNYYCTEEEIVNYINSNVGIRHLILENHFLGYDGFGDCKIGEWFFKKLPDNSSQRFIMLSKEGEHMIKAINADSGIIESVSIFDIAAAKINFMDHADSVINGLSGEINSGKHSDMYNKLLEVAINTVKEEQTVLKRIRKKSR